MTAGPADLNADATPDADPEVDPMGEDLTTMLRTAGRAEELAVAAERPDGPDLLAGLVGDVRRRRVAYGSVLALGGVAAIGLGAAGALALGGAGDEDVEPPAVTVTPTPAPVSWAPPWAGTPLYLQAPSQATWPCGMARGYAGALPTWLAWDVGLDVGQIDLSTVDPAAVPLAVHGTLAPADDTDDSWYAVEHPALPDVVLVQDGFVVGTGTGSAERSRTTFAGAQPVRTVPSDAVSGEIADAVVQDATVTLAGCGGAPLAPGVYEVWVVQGLMLWGPEDGSAAGPPQSVFPWVVRAASGPFPLELTTPPPPQGEDDEGGGGGGAGGTGGGDRVVPPVTEAPSASGDVDGAGSGEVLMSWTGVPNATSYRVYRSASPDGPFSPAAEYEVATAEDRMIAGQAKKIWDASAYLEYVEESYPGPVYFRVAGYNAAGEGPWSGVVCSTPFGGTPC
ncbi:hypothetical protein AFE02nite_17810 [Actinotalea fermentans]|uniref:Fibronectin type-III domain-containing protein n=2 Tax=Actinotalea fermentans TaxID=43671 RepID=A0A511YXX6_9CELL|nr:hypothetical protein AFE02nite_17810 [Actinotalea fermentans]